MSKQESDPQPRRCPVCEAQLTPEGELLCCPEHGLFFRYGPRLLVHVAASRPHPAPLMPWQTMEEEAKVEGAKG